MWNRLIYLSVEHLARELKRAADAHHEYEKTTGKPDSDWPMWYARFLFGTLESKEVTFDPNQKTH